jgi:DNA-binding NtrC family response regulator
VEAGRFREDLYYRLNVVAIDMPPLRERPGDVHLLAVHFLGRYALENDKTIQGFTDEALERLAHYSWPGNVRELENAVERAVVICRGSSITADELLPPTGASATAAPPVSMPPVPGASLAELERYAILRTLEHTGGSTSRAAAMLGISIRKVQYRLRSYAGAPRRRGASVKAAEPTTMESAAR